MRDTLTPNLWTRVAMSFSQPKCGSHQSGSNQEPGVVAFGLGAIPRNFDSDFVCYAGSLSNLNPLPLTQALLSATTTASSNTK